MSAVSPPNAKDVKKVVEERLAAVDANQGVKETALIEWRGAPHPLPVISMPVELLYYNPDTHRVRAQRTLDSVRDEDLKADPFGTKGQAYLHHLLMGDPSDPSKTDPTFEALKDDLRQNGQSESGIIARDGVLINGNTRRAALRELGQPNIRVAVLPPDAGFEDIQSIELSLQLRKDFKRDYSFMNFLLAIDERVAVGWTPEKIQQEFRIRAKTFERSRWILTAIREVIERSAVEGANGQRLALRLVDFETHQGKLEELYRTYTALKSKSPEDAEALREQRLLAIALDKSKTDVRLIEPDFTDLYMKSVLPSSGAKRSAPVSVPGTSITVEPTSPRVEMLQSLTTSVLQAKAVVLCADDAKPTVVVEAGESLKKIESALEDALQQAGKTGRLIQRRFAAVDRLSDANDDLQLTVTAVAEARSTSNFDADDLDEALLSLRGTLTKLAQIVLRDGDESGEGLSWLRAAVASPENTAP